MYIYIHIFFLKCVFDYFKLSLPSSIAQLKKLRTLLLHGNQLTTLPPQIIALKELMEVMFFYRLKF